MKSFFADLLKSAPSRPETGRRGRGRMVPLLFTVFAFCAPTVVVAQRTAAAQTALATPVIEYAANESGGRISISHPGTDSSGVETIRVALLENAAAIRRGDIRSVRVVHGELPAAQVLSNRHSSIRCTFRLTARGGELVLLSDDDAVVAAIHQLLSANPPKATRI